jgi:hypothetical protein
LAFLGTVVDARTNLPIDGAVVSAAPDDPACRHRRTDLSAAESDPGGDALPPIDAPPEDAVSTTTGPDGTFRLDWAAGKAADVVARKPGYGFACAAGAVPGKRLVLRAAAGGSVRGLVRRPDGRPVSGALAFLHARAVAGKRGALLDSTTTDRHGAFELRGVAPGRYALRLRHGSSMPASLDDACRSSRAPGDRGRRRPAPRGPAC